MSVLLLFYRCMYSSDGWAYSAVFNTFSSDAVDFDANLFARVSLAYGYGSVFWSGRVSDGSVVDGDGERDAEFIRSAVSFADGDGGGV